MRESDTENRGSRRSPELYDRLGKGQYERKKNSRGTRAWPCETCTEPWLWAGKGIRWSSSGAITRQHGSVAALPHRLRVCRPRLSNQGVCFLLRETQCAAMADAVRCDGRCSALRWPVQRVALAGAACSVFRVGGEFGSWHSAWRDGRAASADVWNVQPGFTRVCGQACSRAFVGL